MRSTLFTLALALLIPLCAAADDRPVQIRVPDLDKTPITARAFKIRITKLSGSFLKLGNGSIELEVENVSAAFETFSPRRLSLINKDNVQVDIVNARHGDYRSLPPYDPNVRTAALDRRIAPGARIKETYRLSGRLHLPMRFYYDEKLLAEIVE
jgi:hypothetical protein